MTKGSKPYFDDGPGNNSDSGRIFALQCLFESNSNNGPSPGQSNIGRMEDTSVQVPTCGLLVSEIPNQLPRLDFNNGPGDNSNSGRILAPGIYLSPIQIMTTPGPFQSWNDEGYQSLNYRRPFDFIIFTRQNAMR